MSQPAPSLPTAAEPTVRFEGALAVLSLGAGEGRFTGESVAAIDACLDEVLASAAVALITTADSKIWCNGFDTDWSTCSNATSLTKTSARTSSPAPSTRDRDPPARGAV